MNIDRLKYFAAVVETKNLRKAAELVNISPGSMSKAISVLEGELKVKLLRPEGRGIEITEDGQRVYQLSSTLLDECRRFFDEIQRSKPKEKFKLRIGTFEVFSTYFASALLATEFADLDVMMLELTPGNLEKAIEEGLVQYGFTYLPSPNPKIDFIEIGSFEMGVFGIKKWDKIDFEEWPFAVPITPLKINSLEHRSLDMWPATKARRIKYEFELLETALQTSRLGLSVLYCPDFIISLYNRYVLPEFRLARLPYHPDPRRKKIKIFLAFQKGISSLKLIEGKTAKFMRSLKTREPV